MKALTLTQPWATLVAVGAKRIETRSWSTRYSGPLAIHAAKGFPLVARMTYTTQPFFEVMTAHGFGPGSTIPLGKIVATCELVGVAEIDKARTNLGYWKCSSLSGHHHYWELTEQERAFGDYRPGRYAWLLDNIQPLAEPIPARGSLSLWEWAAPQNISAEMEPGK